MVVRGVYSELEKEILENFKKEADTRQGWSKPGRDISPTITSETLKEHAFGTDPWNPFWNSEAYASASRWGSLIAHPFFMPRFSPPKGLPETKKGLFRSFYYIGDNFEYFQPIRPGDTIRVWARPPSLEDSSDLSGKGPRKFQFFDGDCDFVNQRNEIVGTLRQPIEIQLHEGPPPLEKYLPPYGYTQQELDYLAEMTEGEKPRGSEILYWEDVQINDTLQPIAVGPTTYANVTSHVPPTLPGEIPKRTFLYYEELVGGPIMSGYVLDRETGLIYPTHGGRHNNDRAAQYEGGRSAWQYNYEYRYPMARSVTNWMGDDGFICKLSWRHVWRTPVGDAAVVNGKVTQKYVEDGEHMVEVRVWCQDLRGCIPDMAIATVKLVSKEDTYPPIEKVIKR